MSLEHIPSNLLESMTEPNGWFSNQSRYGQLKVRSWFGIRDKPTGKICETVY